MKAWRRTVPKTHPLITTLGGHIAACINRSGRKSPDEGETPLGQTIVTQTLKGCIVVYINHFQTWHNPVEDERKPEGTASGVRLLQVSPNPDRELFTTNINYDSSDDGCFYEEDGYGENSQPY